MKVSKGQSQPEIVAAGNNCDMVLGTFLYQVLIVRASVDSVHAAQP